MSSPGNLTYSDDPCSAFMAAIVRSYAEKVAEQHYLGRTAMQKLAYFAKALGVPIPCSFEIYTYGPYSESVTSSVESLLADDVLTDISNKTHYSNYRLGANAAELLEKYNNLIEPNQAVIDAVVRCLGIFEPPQLELIATLHFIHLRLKQILQTKPEKAQVFDEFRRIKGEKFSEVEIESFYNALENAGLI